MTTKRFSVAAFLAIVCLALPTFAQQSKTVTKGPIVTTDSRHDTGPLLREVAPLLPEFTPPAEHEIENNVNPNHNWKNRVKRDTALQTAENSPNLQTPTFNLEFDGIGINDQFFCNCMPPDNDGAPGTTQYVQYINGAYEVWDKSGNNVLGPLSGNAFWTGFGGGCEADNDGDPVIRFDAAAQRWVASQFDLGPQGSGPFAECIAVSTTADATGSYNRYRFTFTNFPDYPKMSVWPDAYYLTFNNFNAQGTAFVGANVCAADRTKMLAGSTATIQCFQQNNQQFGMLTADLDGATPPAAGTPNFVMELDADGSANLSMFKFHVDFTTPANSTFTGPTLIPVAAFVPLCNAQPRGRCVPQPTAGSDLLESLADRLMFRLVYRNFGDHTTLLATHAIVAGTSGGVRWYEIHNPETTPTIFQSGTYAPDTAYRWMPAIAMDSNQDIAIGYSRSSKTVGQFPSIVYAGRVPSDPAGTLEAEVVLKAGLGSQTNDGGNNRWGDYSSVTIDPSDDCTFWFTEEYLKTTGGFNWSTAIGTFTFPGCAGGSPSFTLSANPSTVSLAQGSNTTSAITVLPSNGFTGNVTLSATGLPTGVTAAFSPNPTKTTSTLTLTASATATTGAATVTVKGVSGSITSTTPIALTITGSGGGPGVGLSPTSLTWTTVVVGVTSPAKTITVTNTGTATLTFGGITATGDFAVAASTKPCTTVLVGKTCLIKVTFTPTQVGTRTGTLTINDNAGNSPQTVPLSGVGGAQATLAPATATYSARTVGTTSPAKVFTLTNKQSIALNSIAISASGDFSVSTTTCTTSLAAKANCKISVTFTPTKTGTRTGTLSVADSASGSPQTAALTGTGK